MVGVCRDTGRGRRIPLRGGPAARDVRGALIGVRGRIGGLLRRRDLDRRLGLSRVAALGLGSDLSRAVVVLGRGRGRGGARLSTCGRIARIVGRRGAWGESRSREKGGASHQSAQAPRTPPHELQDRREDSPRLDPALRVLLPPAGWTTCILAQLAREAVPQPHPTGGGMDEPHLADYDGLVDVARAGKGGDRVQPSETQ